MAHHELLVLNNADQLSYYRFGNRSGTPAFYFHGLPGSGAEGAILQEACRELNIDLIAPDRGGYGQSILQHENRLLQWPAVITQLADALGFDRFYVFAASGGAPYALAVASVLPARVRGVGIGCGLGPVHHAELLGKMSRFAQAALRLQRVSPMLLRLSYGLAARIATRFFPQRAVDYIGWLNGSPDREVLRQSRIKHIIAEEMQLAFAQGSDGALLDMQAATAPWPFTIETITRLHLWHGDRDPIVPLLHSQWLAQHIPDCKLTIVPNEGHFSLAIGHAHTIARCVLEEFPE